jgi:4-amino-4-deoxy-L-arabinose transferase-like glycosyltransferase
VEQAAGKDREVPTTAEVSEPTLENHTRRRIPDIFGGLSRENVRAPWLTLLLVFVVSLSTRLICFTGLVGSDDIFYSIYAERIAEGTYRLEPHHMAIRYGVILPLAAIYKVFGIHEWSTVALPLLASSLAPVLAALVGFQLSGATATWVAGLLLATFPVDARYATILVPESMLQSAVLAAAIVYLVAEARQSVTLGIVSGILLGLAYLIKEPGAFVVTAFVIFAFAQRRWSLGLAVAGGAALVLAAELTWYWVVTQDLLFRTDAMVIHNRQPEVIVANEHLIYRLFQAYPRLMLLPNMDFGLHSLLAGAACVLALVSDRSYRTVFLLLWATVPLLYLNFGTSSFQRFWALPVSPRYVSLIYPPLFVLTGIIVADMIRLQAKKLVAVILLPLVCSVGIACAFATRGTGYRINDVHNLRDIVGVARESGQQVCEITGPRSKRWRQTLLILAPDVIGCSATQLLGVAPNASGLPVSHPLKSDFSDRNAPTHQKSATQS